MRNDRKEKRERPKFAPKEPVRLSSKELQEAGERGLKARRELDRRLAELEAVPPADRSARYR